MDSRKFRCRADPIDEDLDESFSPKTLSFDSTDESEAECSRPPREKMEVAVEPPHVSPVPTKKRKIQTTLSPDFFNGLQIEPDRKRLATITNTGSSKKAVSGKKPASQSTSPFGTLSFHVRKKDHTGDGSKKLLLPTVKERQTDLKRITPETLTRVLRKEEPYGDVNLTLVDCRYPYEYTAGHIKGAVNIFTPDAMNEHFFQAAENCSDSARNIVIFHCEFSSERGPNLAQLLREEDRNANVSRYPNLFYPEIYVLNGGYKAFFENYRSFCDPQVYKPMKSPGHEDEMRLHKKTAKSQGYSRGGTIAKTSVRRCF